MNMENCAAINVATRLVPMCPFVDGVMSRPLAAFVVGLVYPDELNEEVSAPRCCCVVYTDVDVQNI